MISSYQLEQKRKNVTPWLEFIEKALNLILKALAVIAAVFIIKSGKFELLIGGAN